MRRATLAALGVFLGFFSLYLWTLPPSLAAYRDAGEFALSAWSLGISHPPSYPVYVLLGHAADLFPLGNRAYALALLSGLCGAACLAALFLAAARLFGVWASLAGVLLLGLNVTFWVVSGVQEMYTLTLLFASAVLGLALLLRPAGPSDPGPRVSYFPTLASLQATSAAEPAGPGARRAHHATRLWCALWLLYGFSLGNRTDLLLWLPGILVLALPWGGLKGPSRLGGLLARAAGFGLLGLCVYLYLPLRSLRGPWLDWNHPATLANFIGSLTRRGYGGTLDLLSKSYAPGSMFLPNLKVYASHLWLDFGPLGLALVAAGLVAASRADRRRLAGQSLLYAAAGPVFLFMANMPPNPHAMAIVEPHYLLSDMILALWAAEGAAALPAMAGLAAPMPAAGMALAGLLLAQAALLGHHRLADRRWDLLEHDAASNLLRSVPPGSVLVAKKDVQLFSLWYAQRVEGRRPDVRVVAQGLSHSPWYKASFRREGSPLSLGPLREADDWNAFADLNGPKVYASMDTEVPAGVRLGPPEGLAMPVLPPGREVPAPSDSVWRFLVRRGDYRYERRPDFFSSDLVNDHALARQRLGTSFLERGADEAARASLLAAWSMKRLFPEAGAFVAYLRLRRGDLRGARAAYELTDSLFEETLGLTREYRSLPELVGAIRANAADSLLNLGVVCEKLSDPASAERAYLRALEANPRLARARFNLAVLYWGKDWPRVTAELEAALRIDPGYADAGKYLAAARMKASAR